MVSQNGEEVAEMDANGNWMHSNVYLGNELLATYTPTDLVFNLHDWLGTKRVEVGTSGCSTAFVQFPYGDGLAAAGPVIGSTTCADVANEHFTGKERDTETGLDYFGARYYESSMGRWMIPDWSEKPTDLPYADIENPQSLNLYGYIRNNPLTGIDRDGHDWETFKAALSQVASSFSVKINAGVGVEETIGVAGKGIAVGGSATVFAQFSKKGTSTGIDLKYGAQGKSPFAKGKIGYGHTDETLSKKDGVDLPEPGEHSSEDDMSIGASSNSNKTFSIGDETGAGPDLGIEIDVEKHDFEQGMKGLLNSLTDSSKTKGGNDCVHGGCGDKN